MHNDRGIEPNLVNASVTQKYSTNELEWVREANRRVAIMSNA
jgi:hypothetical protein